MTTFSGLTRHQPVHSRQPDPSPNAPETRIQRNETSPPRAQDAFCLASPHAPTPRARATSFSEALAPQNATCRGQDRFEDQIRQVKEEILKENPELAAEDLAVEVKRRERWNHSSPSRWPRLEVEYVIVATSPTGKWTYVVDPKTNRAQRTRHEVPLTPGQQRAVIEAIERKFPPFLGVGLQASALSMGTVNDDGTITVSVDGGRIGDFEERFTCTLDAEGNVLSVQRHVWSPYTNLP